MGVVFAQLFGKEHNGSISGLAKGLTMPAGAFGPVFLGLCRTWTGSYSGMLLFSLVSTQVATLILLFAPLPLPCANALPAAAKQESGCSLTYTAVPNMAELEPTTPSSSELDESQAPLPIVLG